MAIEKRVGDESNFKVCELDASLKKGDIAKYVNNVKQGKIWKESFTTIEAWSQDEGELAGGSKNSHAFVKAIKKAYDEHLPLAFSPDDIWILIVQGVSKHIEQNADKLRSKFVSFDGKKKIVVRRDGFTKGSPNNDWPGCFAEFKTHIQDAIGKDNVKNFVQTFTTTSDLQTTVMNLSLMDGVKAFFEYEVLTRCGIPEVKLLGTLDDWKQIQAKVKDLEQYDLKEWISTLNPILENIVSTYEGKEVDDLFWKSIYKHHNPGGSGAVPRVDGWITHFFPYNRHGGLVKRPSLEELYKKSQAFAASHERGSHFQRSSMGCGGMNESRVPIGIAKTPFVWDYLGTRIDMIFYSGFVGFKNDGGYIRPCLGWAVGEAEELESNDSS